MPDLVSPRHCIACGGLLCRERPGEECKGLNPGLLICMSPRQSQLRSTSPDSQLRQPSINGRSRPIESGSDGN